MKTLEFFGKFNAPLLSEELQEVFPHWIIQTAIGLKAKFKVSQAGERLLLTIPFEEEEQAVRSVVIAHDWRVKSKNELGREKRENDKKEAKKKLLVLGLTNDEINLLVGK